MDEATRIKIWQARQKQIEEETKEEEETKKLMRMLKREEGQDLTARSDRTLKDLPTID